MDTITLSQACEGCLLYKSATGRSPRTIADYKNNYKKLLLFFTADPPIAQITRQDLVKFFHWLHTEYTTDPDGVAPRGKMRLAPKTIYNIHGSISALWKWATDEGFAEGNLVRTIDPPRYENPEIIPFSKNQIQALLKACNTTATWKTANDATTASKRPTRLRDRAIVLLLLDTGIRRAEICAATLSNLDLTNNALHVAGKGKGRDSKQRTVYFGKRTARALWRYITPRLANGATLADAIFVTGDDFPRPLQPDVLRRLLKRLGDRARVPKVYPHRFRHTFAITYLRNGSDTLTLQRLLGHSSLDMVKRYAHIVQADCATAHARAGPVDNWKL